jgi:hypothetical protein
MEYYMPARDVDIKFGSKILNIQTHAKDGDKTLE